MKVVHDGPSLPMLQSDDGGLFRIQKFVGGQWVHADLTSHQEVAGWQAAGQAYKWGYEYLQDRMRSVERNGWAEDCDGEIEHRIKTAVEPTL